MSSQKTFYDKLVLKTPDETTFGISLMLCYLHYLLACQEGCWLEKSIFGPILSYNLIHMSLEFSCGLVFRNMFLSRVCGHIIDIISGVPVYELSGVKLFKRVHDHKVYIVNLQRLLHDQHVFNQCVTQVISLMAFLFFKGPWFICYIYGSYFGYVQIFNFLSDKHKRFLNCITFNGGRYSRQKVEYGVPWHRIPLIVRYESER